MERTCWNLVLTLCVKATEALIKHVRDFLGGEDSEDWKAALKYCVCIDSNDLSFVMLIFLYLANRSPSGKKGEGLIGCMSILGFLGSSVHRVRIYLMSRFYSIHIGWAKFSDSKSEIDINI